jgi:hypothetical protein
MACGVKALTNINIPSLEQAKEAAAVSRMKVCENCEWCKFSICRIVAAKHGKSKANIEHGIRRLSLSCPDGRWGPITRECVGCSRSTVVDDVTGFCKWCISKKKIGREHRISYTPRKVVHVSPNPFKGTPIRHLYFFLYPRYKESTEYHLDRLRKSIKTNAFNGKKICCVATDGDTLQDKYRGELDHIFDEVFYITNDPKRRESAGFVRGLKPLASFSNEEMICLIHGKGQQSHSHDDDTIRMWTEAMYETVVDNWQEAVRAMEDGYPLAGSFKSVGNFATTPNKWHYSGTFYWARSSVLFGNKAWQQMCNQWWAAESYVGRHFADFEGFCLFGDNTGGGSLYHPVTWVKLNKELKEWRKLKES